MKSAGLNVSHITTPRGESTPEPLSDVEFIFEHWVYMFGHNHNRVALGPSRKKVIARALAMYDVATLQLAIDGCAASRWHAGDNDRDRTYQDLELILRNEEHIERFSQWGDDLRKRAAARERAEAEAPIPIAPSDPQRVAVERERVRALAAQLRSGAR